MLFRRQLLRLLSRFTSFRKPSLRCSLYRWLTALILIAIWSLLYLSHSIRQSIRVSHPLVIPPLPLKSCINMNHSYARSMPHYSHRFASLTDHKVLLIVDTQYTKQGHSIVNILEANRFRYRVETTGKNLPPLVHNDKGDKGKFALVIFENLASYTSMDDWNRELLDKYCKKYYVGMLLFTPAIDDTSETLAVKGFPLKIQYNVALSDYYLNPYSTLWRVTKPREVYKRILPGDDWSLFHTNHSTYHSIAYARLLPLETSVLDEPTSNDSTFYTTVLHDTGTYDGIQRIIFGKGVTFWLHKLIFIDSVMYLTHGKLGTSLERYVQIDIDDIFVGQTGTRIFAEDADALVAGQKHLQQLVSGFYFNLGYSGKYYLHGNEREDGGDRRLIDLKDNFRWFCHMWRHEQAHKFNGFTRLYQSMKQNYDFAKNYGLPTFNHYAVAPHHSGVYPVHEPLYSAWKEIWGVKVTSTEEYPHLKPARLRQGFIYKGIMVLPRQTCGLFTHNILLDKYPGGRRRLDKSIQGGELFDTLLYNPVNIYMTHMSNYGNDRLGLYTFESVFKFLQCWTNFKLKSVPPLELAEKYFSLYPEQKEPIWENPCDDKRHLEIWSTNKTCDRFPRFLIVGPQKTGTTALYFFLSMHPSILTSIPSPSTYEEIQFFNSRHYVKGLDWYMQFFPTLPNVSNVIFEKSANYFDNEKVPLRAAALLPKAKIVVILISPIHRAYSWYWHMRTRNDSIALQYSFYEVITATSSSPRTLRTLHNRCIIPGHYAEHLERWLDYYPSRQVYIVDGDLLKSDPSLIMKKLQHYLRIEPVVDYSQILKFDNRKGFFCQLIKNKTNCLGSSKGRKYPQIDEESSVLLKKYYRKHNEALRKLLLKIDQPFPDWLDRDLADI